MLLMAEKGIGGEICHAIHSYVKLTTDIWTIMIKTSTAAVDRQHLKMEVAN